MDYEEAIKYLYDLKIFGMSLGLERIEYLLNALGSPHKGMKAIHVAGTNGKGSVCAMLSFILQAAGYKVGLFTSPHLVSFEERIVVNKRQIPEDKVCLLVSKIKPIAKKMAESGKFEHPTFFEIVTAMAFLHFNDENVDYAVMEVGLGGRLDATNVLNPLISVITTVALDHTHVLGNNLDDVAREKSGIIKQGVPVVTGVENDAILGIIRDICREKECEVYASKELGAYDLKESDLDVQVFDIQGLDNRYENLRLHLLGKHQLKNALIATFAVDVLIQKGVNISEKNVKEGLENSRWPGRLEIIQKNPTIILDCAHNPAGMKTLRSALKELFKGSKIVLVIGIMRDKDIPGIIKEIAGITDEIVITKPTFERAAEPEIIESEAKKYCDNVSIKYKVAEAVEYAVKNASFEDVICITGSIFNVGEAMELLGKKAT